MITNAPSPWLDQGDRRRLGGRTVLALAVLVLSAATGCTVGSAPTAAPSVEPSTTISTTAPQETTTTPTSSGPTATFDPADLPKVGECRYIADSGFQRFTDVSRVTACDDEHTAETIWVGEVTGSEADERVPDYLTVITDAHCDVRATEHFGSADWVATRLVSAAFVAPLEQWTLGARWVRCDLYIPEHGTDGFRDGEATSAPYVLDEATTQALAYCSTYDPDEPELALSVDCAEPHNYEIITPTLDLSDLGDEFPGEDAIGSAAAEHCFPALSAFVGSEPETLFFTWSQPDEERWDVGARWVVCGIEIVDGRVAGTLRGVGDAVTVIPFEPGEDDPAIDPYADGA